MKLITLSDEQITSILEDVKGDLEKMRLGTNEDKITVNLKDMLSAKAEEPTICVTAHAYLKMRAIVQECDKEVAWHGTVERFPDNRFLISDIELYPQTVTAATVDSDTEKYVLWQMKHSDEELKSMCFQGHSHVNMGVSPSTTDYEFYNEILEHVPKDGFYIFAVMNKHDKMHWILFDLDTNLIYEDSDITVRLVDEQGNQYCDWAEQAVEEYIEQPKTTITDYRNRESKKTSGYYGGGYTGWPGMNDSYDPYDEDDELYPGARAAAARARHQAAPPTLAGHPARKTKACCRCQTPVVGQTKKCPTCKGTKFFSIAKIHV